MAQIFLVNIYRINDVDTSVPQPTGFNPANVKLRPITSTTPVVAGPNSIRMYSIIEEHPTGLRVNSVNNFAAETVAQLQTLANA